MKYNGFYFWMFKSPMKKVLAEKYGREYAADIMKKSKKVYRELVEKADDIGDDNPMAYNELFALAFVAPYVASEKKIPPTAVQEMMRRSLYHIKWYFAKTDLNTDKGKAENKKSVVKYAKWYTPEKEAKYPTSFKVDFVGQPYEGACYYRITRCPICIYAECKNRHPSPICTRFEHHFHALKPHLRCLSFKLPRSRSARPYMFKFGR